MKTATTNADAQTHSYIIESPIITRRRYIQAEQWRQALTIAAERDARRLHGTSGTVGPVRVAEEGRGWIRAEVFLGRRTARSEMAGKSYTYDVSY